MKTAIVITPDLASTGYRFLTDALGHLGFRSLEIHPAHLRDTLGTSHIDLVIVGLGPTSYDTGVISCLAKSENKIPIVWLTDSQVVSGAVDKPYRVTYPNSCANLAVHIQTCFKAWSASSQPSPTLDDEGRLIGNSPQMRLIKNRIRRIAATDCNVLITGETGTGKECVASLIYSNSERRNQPFVSINCAAIPDSLLESELFGYEKGAFTGAGSRFVGKMKLADRGTIFFDEIGDMSALAQAKILRSLETREVQHLGSTKSSTVDIRVIAATNKNLDASASSGSETFRSDLYYRLNVARIQLPPLRERKGDITLLVEHYIRKYSEQFSLNVVGCTDEVFQSLLHYDWPGNIREFKNVIEATFIEAPGELIEMKDLPLEFRNRLSSFNTPSLTEYDRLIIALMASGWNKSLAAKKLGCSRMTVYRIMTRYNLNVDKTASSG